MAMGAIFKIPYTGHACYVLFPFVLKPFQLMLPLCFLFTDRETYSQTSTKHPVTLIHWCLSTNEHFVSRVYSKHADGTDIVKKGTNGLL